MVSNPSRTSRLRIAVIGGGVIGLSCALELRSGGADVCVYESGAKAGAGTSSRAAGMLGSYFEALGPPAMLGLMQRSARAWPAFAARIERDAGDIGYSQLPSVFCALTEEEAKERLDASVQRLTTAELRRIEPAIDGPIVGGAILEHDRQVDPVLLVERLAALASSSGIEIRLDGNVGRIECGAAFRTPDGREWDRVLITTGASKPPVFAQNGFELNSGVAPILPVKGQMLALKPWPGAPRHVIRLAEVYIVPKERWVLVGATEEPRRTDLDVIPGVLAKLRSEAAAVVSGVAPAEQAAAWAGIRPGTRDGQPMIGETAIPGVFAAMGHYRNGILLALETARIIAAQMLDGNVTSEAAAFSPLRFDKPATAPHSP